MLAENSTPQTVAMDYRTIGYRECINEMVAYMVNVEGLGPAEPLHSRLISHLHHHLATMEQTHAYYYNAQQAQQPFYCSTSPTRYPQVAPTCKPEPPSPTYQPEAADYCFRRNDAVQSGISYGCFNEQNSAEPVARPSTAQLQCYFTPQSSWV